MGKKLPERILDKNGVEHSAWSVPAPIGRMLFLRNAQSLSSANAAEREGVAGLGEPIVVLTKRTACVYGTRYTQQHSCLPRAVEKFVRRRIL